MEKQPTKEGKLTPEPISAVKSIAHAVAEITKYCITELDFKKHELQNFKLINYNQDSANTCIKQG